MKIKLSLIASLCAAAIVTGGYASAGSFLYGDETKGATITSNESDLNIRIRFQPRIDYGDLIKSKDSKSYSTESDLYLRRVRLEMGGSLLAKTIKYNLTLSADKWEQTGTTTSSVSVFYAFVQWEADDAYNVTFGKAKLPYSRVSLTTSSKQLIIERPASTEAAKKVFGKTDPYYQPKLAVHGKFLGSIVAYEAAVADGWQNGEAIHTTPARTVYKSNPLYVGRVELSAPGWVEKSKSDAHLGNGQHLTLGVNLASQSSIEYGQTTPATTEDNRETRTLKGFDLSGHYKGFTAQFEYNDWKIETSDRAVANSHPKGWYGQAGYFIDIKGLNVEPVVRYEIYDQDSKKQEMEEKNSTVGVNWYGKGHSFKVGFNWVRTRYEDMASGRLTNDNRKNVYQLQGQMYF
ncbi:MAG: porin [Deltaproteobacteria bacterium]